MARVSAVYAVAGFLAFAGLIATFVLGVRGTERAVARALGLPPLRWFENAAAPAWKRFLLRATSSLVPFAICVAIFGVVIAARGLPEEATTVVDVLPDSAAGEAGMQDGDRVVAVGDAPVTTWDELRAQVAKHSGPVPITVERAGRRHVLSVTPRQGRIGTAAAPRMREAGLGEIARHALVLPLRIVADSAKAVVAQDKATDLRGPVGIVSETGKAANEGWYSLLYFLAGLGSYCWPFIVATHAFDVATGWLFQLTFTAAHLPERVVQIARLRLAMYFSLGCWVVLVGAHLAASLADIPGTAALAIVMIPGVWAVWPLLWVSARSLGKGNWPLGVVLPVVVIPCAAPIMAVVIAQQLGKEEQRLRSHAQAAKA